MKYILHIIIIFYCLCSCNEKKDVYKNILIDNKETIIEANFSSLIFKLNENKILLGEILSFDFINNKNIIVSTKNPGNLIIYDDKKNQVKEINRVGRGPYEYINPAIVKAYEKKIYIWCSSLLKLIVYNIDGTPHKEYQNFKGAITDFSIYNNKIFFYMAGGNRESIIQIYDLEKKEIYKRIGQPSNEDLILNTLSCSGANTLFKNRFIYASSSKLDLNIVNTFSYSVDKIKIIDPEFIIDKIDKDPILLMNTDRKKAYDYILENSVVIGMYSLNNVLILMSENGYVSQVNNAMDNSNRFVKVYIFDTKFKLQKVFKFNHNYENNRCLYLDNGEYLYNIKFVKNKRYGYYLNKIEF